LTPIYNYSSLGTVTCTLTSTPYQITLPAAIVERNTTTASNEVTFNAAGVVRVTVVINAVSTGAGSIEGDAMVFRVAMSNGSAASGASSVQVPDSLGNRRVQVVLDMEATVAVNDTLTVTAEEITTSGQSFSFGSSSLVIERVG
jgi:hypothetical protein